MSDALCSGLSLYERTALTLRLGLGDRRHSADRSHTVPVEESQELFPDGIRDGYKQANLIWDGNTQRISLKAARNETIAFQIIIERAVEKLTDVKVRIGELTGLRRQDSIGERGSVPGVVPVRQDSLGAELYPR